MPRSLLLLVALATGCARSPRDVAVPPAPTPVASPAPRFTPAPPPVTAEVAPSLRAAQAELERTMRDLGSQRVPPYYVAYGLTTRESTVITASLGALLSSHTDRRRVLDTDVRVGSYELDNTRRLRGERPGIFGGDDDGSTVLPVDDDTLAIRTAIWRATDRKYRTALEQLVKVRANQAVKVAQEDASADFSRERPSRFVEASARLEVDVPGWEARLRESSAVFRERPQIHESQVQLEVQASNRGLVTSEGTLVQTGQRHAQIRIWAATTADDGMELSRYETLDAPSTAELPGPDEVRARIDRVIEDLMDLRAAPVATPYIGPAILEGRAAGVFFHEIFGHRVEGDRQKDEEEGQTFTKKLGQPVMPSFIDVYDDPTLEALGDTHLNGFYRYDDEGVAAGRASLVEGGIFRGFLMSRSPIAGFPASNGHGRREEGYAAEARQGNLVVRPRVAMSREDLKRALIAEVKRQNLSYGLRFTVVEGGYTMTRRQGAQAFKVLPVMVYGVYPDGREELVRGADLEGTPLIALSRILAAGDDYTVFNGFCGAESGFVPVAAVSPSLLLEQVEIARKGKSQDRPPILPAPPLEPERTPAPAAGVGGGSR